MCFDWFQYTTAITYLTNISFVETIGTRPTSGRIMLPYADTQYSILICRYHIVIKIYSDPVMCLGNRMENRLTNVIVQRTISVSVPI